MRNPHQIKSFPHRLAPTLILALSLVCFPLTALAADATQPPSGAETVTARTVTVTETQQAVGTIRPRTETRIEAQITARILEMRVRPGSRVKKGDVLVVLDTRELESRRQQSQQAIASANAATQQARQAKTAAQAAFTRIEAQYKRIRALYETNAVAKSEMDQAEAAYAQAEAALKQATEGVSGAMASEARSRNMLEEAGIALDYGVIRALDDGEVVRREAEPGDLAFPGKALLVLQTGGSLRLDAQVREGLIRQVRTGTRLTVMISAIGDTPLEGVVEEVVPAADPLSRTFEVRIGLPADTGAYATIYPGMFGRAFIPVGERSTVLIPARAVTRVGQLETVRMQNGGAVTTTYIKTGPRHDDEVEVLSGLNGGETLLLERTNVQ
ncbi:efflux RND transporter periplasmic adaptor subunit [Desulfovibrio mangrovi]|uniref:efflux RND transporter periplasmic adaptor subunit n=1 Tax=Desulfovibrio mangrovi TaxID=2976983 RepID=UPI002247CB83|nr:efflux RND transporter periplasmic adaptor subunit [Desulfovibrio mangrovi]UZP67513.1 efflux RND transporter periplasmic adaptor subunit [Desulfovibrio mangrovi]